MKQELKRNIVSILVHNNPHTLMKISGLLARRGLNVRNISYGRAKKKEMSRITLVLEANNDTADRIQKQLYKVLEIEKASLIEPDKNIEKELALIKVKPVNMVQSEFINLVNLFGGKIIDTDGKNFIVELTGSSKKIDSFINLLGREKIVDIASSGVVAIDRLKEKSRR